MAKKTLAPPQAQPSQGQIDREIEEFNQRILPMFNQQLKDRNYFCGESITAYDLQVYSEIKSIQIYDEEMFRTVISFNKDVLNWIKRVENIPEVSEIEVNKDNFAKSVLKNA